MSEFTSSLFSHVGLSLAIPTGPKVTVLIIPADGTPPRIEHLTTVNVHDDGNVDRSLYNVPNMRAYSGTGSGWSHRDIARVDIADHVAPALNGFYYGFKSFDVDDLPMSKHGLGIYGDACIVKMAPERYCTRGFRIVRWGGKYIRDNENEMSRFAVYDEITMDVVDTGLWKEIVKKLSKV